MAPNVVDIWEQKSATSAFIYVAIIVIIYIPLSIYHGYKYYKQRHHIIMKKRYSSIMCCEIVVIIIKISLDAIRDATRLYLDKDNLIIKVEGIIAGFFYKAMVCIWLWRFYMLHFDLNWTHIMLKQEWKSVINQNQNIFINTLNFYLKSKKTFGNKKWIFKYFIAPLIIFMWLTTDVLQFIFGSIMNISNNTVNIIKLSTVPISIMPSILLTILYFRIPQLKDHFFIKKELGLLLISILMMYISYWSYYFFIQFQKPSSNTSINQHEYDKIVKILHPTSTFLVVFFDFACLMISTYYVNKKVSNIIINQSYSIHNKYKIYKKDGNNKITIYSAKGVSSYIPIDDTCNDNDDDNTGSISVQTDSSAHLPLIQFKFTENDDNDNDINIISEDNQDKIPLTILDIFTSNSNIELFMEHLQYELSSENLLSFIEFIQFEKYVLVNNNNQYGLGLKGKQLMCERIIFAHKIPNSLIVFDLNDHINEKAIRLYNKYIHQDAEYQINIPFIQRNKFKKWINKINTNNDIDNESNVNNGELIIIIDNTMEELYDLLLQSFYRFQRTAAYKQLTK